MGSVLRTRGSSATRSRSGGHPQPRSGAALTSFFLLPGLSLTHTNTHTHTRILCETHFLRWSLSFFLLLLLLLWEARGDTARYLFISCVSPDSQPRRTNCVFARRGRTSFFLWLNKKGGGGVVGEKNTAKKKKKKNTREKTPVLVAPPVFFYFLSVFFFFLRFISCCQTQGNHGTDPPFFFCSEDERKLDLWSRLWGLFYWIYFAVEEKEIRGRERSCAQNTKKREKNKIKPRSSSSLLFLSLPLSLHLSICLPILSCPSISPICFHVFRSVRFC